MSAFLRGALYALFLLGRFVVVGLVCHLLRLHIWQPLTTHIHAPFYGWQKYRCLLCDAIKVACPLRKGESYRRRLRL